MARRDFEGLERRRRRSAQLFEEGLAQADVARRLQVTRTTALRWYRSWSKGGLEGLRGAGRAGRKPRLSEAQQELVVQALLEGPLAWGYETELWTLPRVAEVIREVTGVSYHPGHVWRVLRQLGWSRQKPTTRARERDEVAIGRWVRETWPVVKKTPRAAERPLSSSMRAGSPSGRRSSAAGRRGARRRS
jgi:transposase